MGEEREVDQVEEFLHDLAGKEVTEEHLATFLGYAGFAKDPAEARQLPGWERWVAHRMALSWQSDKLDRSGRTVEELSAMTRERSAWPPSSTTSAAR